MTTPGQAPALAVVDLDGVLADTRHRLYLIAGRPKDWDGFFAAAEQDEVHPEGRALLRELGERGLDLVYLTGRPRRCERATVRWLRRHDLPVADLLMRAEGDRRPAAAVKLGQLRGLARQRPIAVLVDDDPEVVAQVRRARPALVASVLLADWQPSP